MKTLYHFTSIFWLPDILREGITRGEIPVGPHLRYSDCPKAANLTSNPNREGQQCWCHGGASDKTKFRLTVELPDCEIISCLAVKRQYKIADQWIKKLAPNGEQSQWFFALGGVRPEQICTVAVREPDGNYLDIPCDELPSVLEYVEQERQRIEYVSTPGGARCVAITADNQDSWLFDGSPSRKGWVDPSNMPFLLQ
jgi:hypothetical protein